MPAAQDMNLSDLATGDRLLSIGGVGFAQLRDPAAPPVLVCDVRPAPDDTITEITTSSGVYYTHSDAPISALRDDTVRTDTVLLISRRQMLHATLLGYGVPVIRRTPVEAGAVPAVTADEWRRAPLIVIDGYLAQQTLRDMWLRGDLPDRPQIVMVGTDPDDIRLEGRQQTARARMLALLPYDATGLADLFSTATGRGISNSTHFAALAPAPGQPTP